jgi:hypothetical protein
MIALNDKMIPRASKTRLRLIPEIRYCSSQMRQWDLEQRIDEGSDSSSLGKDDETPEQP